MLSLAWLSLWCFTPLQLQWRSGAWKLAVLTASAWLGLSSSLGKGNVWLIRFPLVIAFAFCSYVIYLTFPLLPGFFERESFTPVFVIAMWVAAVPLGIGAIVYWFR
jgi:hypothetical protein